MVYFNSKTITARAVITGLLFLGAGLPAGHAQSQSAAKVTETRDDQKTDGVKSKLARIIVPSIEFRSTRLPDAVEYLRQTAKSVNIVLKLPAAAAVPPRSVLPSSDTGVPGVPASAETTAVTQPAAASAVPSANAFPSANTRITLTLHNIPLLEALKYIASQAGLKVKIEPYAVTLVPLSENTDTMVTAVFRVPPNFISNVSGAQTGTALDQPATAAQ